MDDADFQARLQAASDASHREPADPRNMYEGHYAARKLLVTLKDQLMAIFTAASPDSPELKVVQGQLARVCLRLGQNLAHCQETSEGKEMMELAQALLEALRSRQLYDFNQAERERKQKALLEAEKEERLQRLKTEAAKKGVATQDKRHAEWLPDSSTDLDAVPDTFPIPTAFGDVCLDHVDMLMEVYNNLAMQWSGWHEELKAEKLLLNAQRIYAEWGQHSPVKRLEALDESDSAKTVSASYMQSVMEDFHEETKTSAGLWEAERTKQSDALQQRLLEKRKKKGLPPEPSLLPDGPSAGPLAPSSPTDAGAAAAAAAAAVARLERQQELALAKVQLLEQRRALERAVTPEGQQVAREMDAQYAVTCYALGQIYSKLDKPHQAAACYLRVLNRQLRMQDFDRMQWIQDAANLAQYYIGESNLPQAEHCLNAADLFLSASPSPPAALVHCLDLAWGKYYHRLLKLSSEVRTEVQRDPAFVPGEDRPYTLVGPHTVAIKAKPHVPKAQFDRLPIPAPGQEVQLASDLTEVRCLFQKALERYEKVVSFYNIDDFTEERIFMMQEMSGLFEMMASYEKDLEAKRKLHQRRIPCLVDFLDKLENAIFTNVLRQYRFELGNVYQTLADLGLDVARGGTAPLNKEEVNEQLAHSFSYFDRFVSSFRTEWDMIQQLKDPRDRAKEFTLEEDYLLPYIMGCCSLAVITMKTIPGSEEEHAANVAKAIARYQHCIDFAKKCKLDSQPNVREHLKLCREMVQLLPQAKFGRSGPSAGDTKPTASVRLAVPKVAAKGTRR